MNQIVALIIIFSFPTMLLSGVVYKNYVVFGFSAIIFIFSLVSFVMINCHTNKKAP